ncbi:nucleotidyltransferase domain-containing protein [Pseudactinotalea suaedae]|uniref:nucleotidyltransferase domain-containing protein n=1 Tax=Pseudactinotalea suaedae TaxID=1524924 RepID=UPI0012E11B1A|nr:nucleotidyltransferase domain-containing protein [Pseudactinotalea suaedae]
MTPPDLLLHELSEAIVTTLGNQLVGLYVHGSYVAGDFEPARSDLDLLAVLHRHPDPASLELVRPLHAGVAVEHPGWADRIEVDYLSLTTLRTLTERPGPMMRISPGEPLHLFEGTRHYLINIVSAREDGQTLHGPALASLLPRVPAAVLFPVVREHVASWPEWVQDARGRPGAQAYAVLTLCRALHLLEVGDQVSKRQAGSWGLARLPEWADLIAWASEWWYHGGTEADPGRFAEVETFVRAVSGESREQS